MQFAISNQSSTVDIVDMKRLRERLSSLMDNQFTTVRPIPDEDVLCVWSITDKGCVRLIEQFADEDYADAVEVARANERDDLHCVVLPKSLGRPSFASRKAVSK
ncbi:MAG: hypothetical protein AAGJ40_09405 [Planctomycetota bacterium]